MYFRLLIEVALQHTSGKFASYEDLVESVIAEVQSADPGQIDTDNDATYEVATFEVSEAPASDSLPPAHRAFTANEWHSVSRALSVAAQTYEDDAKTMRRERDAKKVAGIMSAAEGYEKLAAQFDAQAKEAREIAARLDE